jgi:hypothetical protein
MIGDIKLLPLPVTLIFFPLMESSGLVRNSQLHVHSTISSKSAYFRLDEEYHLSGRKQNTQAL